MMFCAWFLLTFGVLFARYTRWAENAVWFHVHQTTQYLGFGISIIGVILGLCMTHSHFQAGYHGILGVVITSLSIAQVLSAIFRPHPPTKGHSKTLSRKLFELFHWWVGRSLLILAAVQIYSGIQLIGYPIVLQYGIFVACIVAIVIVGEIVSCVAPQKSAIVPCFGNCIQCPAKEVVVDVAAIRIGAP